MRVTGRSLQMLVNLDGGADCLPPEKCVDRHESFLPKAEQLEEPDRLIARSFDLDRCEADPVAFMQRLIRGHRLPVDANQIVVRLARGNLLLEKLANVRAVGDLNVVGETAAVVVDKQ